MITREQVADLQPGDVVELRDPSGLTVCGPLTTYGEGSLVFGPNVNTGAWTVRTRMGDPGGLFVGWTLTVVSRAPRPLYVNHPRTEPAPGDVVRIEFDEPYDDDSCVNVYLPIPSRPHDPWLSIRHDEGMRYSSEQVLPGPTTKGRAVLLVDGETGQVVP